MRRSNTPTSSLPPSAAGISAQSTISALALRPLLDALAQRAIRPAMLLHSARLPEDTLSSGKAPRLRRADLYRLCDAVITLTGEPAFALHWAEHLPARAFNPVADLVYHSATMRESMESLMRFQKLLADDISLRIEERDDLVVFRCIPMVAASLDAQRFISEVMMVGLFRRIEAFGASAHLLHAHFSYSAPGHWREYDRVFEGRASFAQPYTGLVLAADAMDVPSPHHDAEFHQALCSFGERKLRGLNGNMPYAARVRDSLLQVPSPRQVEMRQIAHALGLSERSLRRRLLDEGTNYAAVCDEALESIAKSFLLEQGRSIQDTAFELGFADKAAFHRAFKRWTGTTPNVFRLTPLAQVEPTSMRTRFARQTPHQDHVRRTLP